ncbi:MAG: hypothetical protein Q7V40_06555 [Pseudolabrys sp.]|nr:hypothetical protein [Pseudolabrys sp.]
MCPERPGPKAEVSARLVFAAQPEAAALALPDAAEQRAAVAAG